MHDIKKRLMEKGWKQKEINKTVKIIKEAKKHPHIQILDKAIFWISLFLAIIGNLLISVSLIPILLTLRSFPLYLTIIVMGASFGLLFELLIRTIEHLESKHHIFLSIIIPLIAVINVIIIVLYSNRLEEILNIQNLQNPLLVAIVYAIAFMLPYIVYQLFLRNK